MIPISTMNIFLAGGICLAALTSTLPGSVDTLNLTIQFSLKTWTQLAPVKQDMEENHWIFWDWTSPNSSRNPLKMSSNYCCRSVAQLCPTLCSLKDCNLPGSSVYGFLQARILEWVAISFYRGSSQPRNQTQVSCIVGRFFTVWVKGKSYLSSSYCSFFFFLNFT